jgi:hypothetical protein
MCWQDLLAGILVVAGFSDRHFIMAAVFGWHFWCGWLFRTEYPIYSRGLFLLD